MGAATCDYDVIVIGGGPAGASAARAAVEGGLKTLLVEKSALPRPKSCSGFLFALSSRFIEEDLGGLPVEVRAEPHRIEGIRIHLPTGRRFDIAMPGQNVWRDRFDSWLCRESGAEIRDLTRVVDFSEWQDRVEVVCSREGGKVGLTTRVMIAADGALSRIAKRIDPTFNDGLPCFYVQQDYYGFSPDIGLERGYFHVFTNPELGLYPVAHFKDDHLALESCVEAGERVKPVRERFAAWMRDEYSLGDSEPGMTMGCRVVFPSSVNRFCLGTDRVLLAGDAAGFVNAGGEGISSALATGRLAGLAAAGAGKLPPGPAYRCGVKTERERTAREWVLPAVMTGRAWPEMSRSLKALPLVERLRVMAGMLAWVARGGVIPGLQPGAFEVILRRLLNRGYDFRA